MAIIADIALLFHNTYVSGWCPILLVATKGRCDTALSTGLRLEKVTVL